MSRKLVLFNRAGLCNRIDNIINGLFLNDIFRNGAYDITLFWPITPHCAIEYNKLFEEPKFNTIISEDSREKLKEIKQEKTCEIALETFSIPSNMLQDKKYISKYLNLFVPERDIYKKAKKFIDENNIDKSVFSVHLRSWEFFFEIDKKKALGDYDKRKGYLLKKIREEIALNRNIKIFLISDSSQVEKEFKNIFPKNIIIKEKKASLEVNDKKEEMINDKNYNFETHLNRNEELVKESLIDLLIMSKTKFIPPNVRSGSFTKTCGLMSNYYDFDKLESYYS